MVCRAMQQRGTAYRPGWLGRGSPWRIASRPWFPYRISQKLPGGQSFGLPTLQLSAPKPPCVLRIFALTEAGHLTGTVQKAYDLGWAMKLPGISYNTHHAVVFYAETAQPIVEQQSKRL